MKLFNGERHKQGVLDVIRCDEPSYLVWKWHPAESQQDSNNRENAIRWGGEVHK